MKKKKIIGIIGPGSHFIKKIHPVIIKQKELEIGGVLRKKKIKFKNYINYNEKEFFKKNFDFVYISSPNHSHEKYIIKSLHAGFNVICEKPFITRKKRLKHIIKIAEKKKKLIFEAFMYLYHPAFTFVFNTIKNKKFGKLKYVISNFRYPSLKKDNQRYDKNSGGGFFYDSASYLISLENHLFHNKINSSNYIDQKIKKNVDLRGSIVVHSSSCKRFYFWGEGQRYSNNVELFFDKATVFIDKFFSKKTDEKIIVKIYGKHNKEIKIRKKNHFDLMFKAIIKNYKNINFQKKHILKIKKQSNLLSKLS